jgi:hypothetical protein
MNGARPPGREKGELGPARRERQGKARTELTSYSRYKYRQDKVKIKLKTTTCLRLQNNTVRIEPSNHTRLEWVLCVIVQEAKTADEQKAIGLVRLTKPEIPSGEKRQAWPNLVRVAGCHLVRRAGLNLKSH